VVASIRFTARNYWSKWLLKTHPVQTLTAKLYDQIVSSKIQILAAVSFFPLLFACSNEAGSFGNSERANPGKCQDNTETEITVDGADLQINMGHDPYSGELVVTAVKQQIIDEPFEDPFIGGMVVAQGHFVGIRFRLKNDLNSSVQPSSVLFDNMQITDGKQSWEVSDYSGIHSDAPSWAWSANYGDEQGATDVGAGFESYTWALFDVPKTAVPTAIAYQSEGPQYCFGLPSQG
jgi:hypothetical protein